MRSPEEGLRRGRKAARRRLAQGHISMSISRPPASKLHMASLSKTVCLWAKGRFTDPISLNMAAEIYRLADEELASVNRRAADCPFLAHWHAYYRTKSAALIERTIRMFAEPERTDLEGLRQALLDRVRTAARQWIMLGMPGADSASLMPPGMAAPSSVEGGEVLARKAESPGSPAPPPGSAAAVRQQLGDGQPLDSGVRSRMERGFRTGFSDVRVHTDSRAARVASDYSARAFAVGKDVGFAPGKFRPGSLAGDALIAHELAHVVQQRGETIRRRRITLG